MKRITQFLLAALVAGGISNACNEPSSFGSEILPTEDNISIEYTDTLSIKASSEKSDSIITYSESLQFTHNLLGQIYDPVFGLSRSQIYSQLRLGTRTEPNVLEGAVLDSIVMRVAFSEAIEDGLRRHYFNIDKTSGNVAFGADIRLLNEPLDRNGVYYSNQTFEVGKKIGQFKIYDFAPYIEEGNGGSFYEFKLDHSLWEDLLDHDPDVFKSDVILSEVLNGIAFIPAPTDISRRMYGMAALDFSGRTYITFHFHNDSFTDSEGNPEKYIQVLSINSNTARSLNFEQRDSMGITSMVSTYTSDPALSEEYVFIQGLEGWNAKLEFPHLDELGSIAVNDATLELFVKDRIPGFFEKDHPGILIGSYENNSGSFNIIEDVVGANGGILPSYGGVKRFRIEDGEYYNYYSLNISKHLQRVVNGDFANPALYISVFDKQESASRVVLGGPKNPNIGMKLKLTYSNL